MITVLDRVIVRVEIELQTYTIDIPHTKMKNKHTSRQILTCSVSLYINLAPRNTMVIKHHIWEFYIICKCVCVCYEYVLYFLKPHCVLYTPTPA